MTFKKRTIILSMGIALMAQVARADVTLVTFQCQAIDPVTKIQLDRDCQEMPSSHGMGHIHFLVSMTGLPKIKIQREAFGQRWAVDNIEYSDKEFISRPDSNLIQASFNNIDYDSSNSSTITINGKSNSMACHFSTSQAPVCTNWCCHHNCP